jgi:formylmethanofuran dehydrogenase subunit E
MYCPDNYSQWENHERQQEAWLRKRPVCCYCGEHIQDDYFYQINDEVICKDCLDGQFRKYVEDYIE